MRADRDEIADAMSAPIAVLKALCSSGDVAIAGYFADLLSSQIAPGRQTRQFFPGTHDEVISSAGLQDRSGCLVIQEALPTIMPKVDALILADRSWAHALCHLDKGFQRLRTKIRKTLVFPVQLKPKTALWCWGDGCSFPEISQDGLWMWTDSETPEMEAEFQSSSEELHEIFLEYQVIWPDGRNGKVTLSQPLTEHASVNIQGRAQKQPVQLVDGRAIIKWWTDVLPRSLPNELRLISFGIKDLRITDAQGNVVLAAPEIYDAPLQPGSFPYEETSLRCALHHAGFPRVGGWIVPPGRPSARRRMIVSSGAPGFDQVYGAGTSKSRVDSLIHEHEIAWVIAQACPSRAAGL